jgi:GTP-binding protein Era
MTARCGYVAVVGAPNAGKSTLLNRLAGAKLAIATPKAQTTRRRTTGIVLRGETQILVVDTPGIFAPRRRLDRAMVAAAWTGARDADLALLLVDAKDGLTAEVRAIAEKLTGRAWLVLNKIDLVSLPALLPLTEALTQLVAVERTLMISAATGDGVTDLLDALADAMPEGPHLYPDEDITDLSDRALAAELVREQILLQVHEEVPHGTTVETESFREQRNGSVRVEATIYVARPGHKAILIGAKGTKIRAIGAAARAQLASILEKDVHLFLNVKDRPGWDEETARLRALGLEDS